MSIALFIVSIMFLILGYIGFLGGLYVFYSHVIFTVARKLGAKNPWIAWIPVANQYYILWLADMGLPSKIIAIGLKVLCLPLYVVGIFTQNFILIGIFVAGCVLASIPSIIAFLRVIKFRNHFRKPFVIVLLACIICEILFFVNISSSSTLNEPAWLVLVLNLALAIAYLVCLVCVFLLFYRLGTVDLPRRKDNAHKNVKVPYSPLGKYAIWISLASIVVLILSVMGVGHFSPHASSNSLEKNGIDGTLYVTNGTQIVNVFLSPTDIGVRGDIASIYGFFHTHPGDYVLHVVGLVQYEADVDQAKAWVCAAEQGRQEDYILGWSNAKASDTLVDVAVKLGFNEQTFKDCLRSDETDERVADLRRYEAINNILSGDVLIDGQIYAAGYDNDQILAVLQK